MRLFVRMLFALATAVNAAQAEPAQPQAQTSPIGRDVSPPLLINKVEPAYSEQAHKANLSGTVLLSLIVDQNGTPQDIRVIRGLGMGLDEKAIEAVTKWRFRPAMKAGQPVATPAQVEVNFRLLSPAEASRAMGTPSNPGFLKPLPASEWPTPKTAEDFVLRGHLYLREQKYSQAVADANEALRINADYIPAFRLRGQVNENNKNFAEAIKDYNVILERDPNWADVHFHRGLAHSGLRQPDLAVADYTDAIKLDPYAGAMYNVRGRTYLELGQYEKALPDLNRAIELLPGFPPAYENRAKLFDKTNQLQNELADLEVILRLSPASEWARAQREEVLRRMSTSASH